MAERDAAACEAYERLCAACPYARAKAISTAERDRRALCESTTTYGEVLFEPFELALRKIRHLYGGLAAPGGRFVDVGSGCGKPVFAAALLHQWDHLLGIELLGGLHAAALELQDRWQSADFQKGLAASGKRAHGGSAIELQLGDATRVDWSSADVVFMNSTCYDERLMQALAAISDRMRPGAFAITLTKRLPSGLWKVLECQTHRMTWGSATVYIQRKQSSCGVHQFVGVAPTAPTPGDYSNAARLLAASAPGYTSASIALDFSRATRENWTRQPEEAALGGGGMAGGGGGHSQ